MYAVCLLFWYRDGAEIDIDTGIDTDMNMLRIQITGEGWF